MTREEAYNRIDAIIAKHEIDDEYVTITSFLDYDALRMARKALEQKSKTGHWIEDLSEYDNKYPKHIQAIWKCSECKKKQIRKSNYCPDCGAKMLPTDSDCDSCEHQNEVDGSTCVSFRTL